MPLPIFKTQEEIPEAFRPEYEEQNGEWRPKPAPAPDVTNLNTALAAERTRAENEEKARKKAEKERDDLKRTQTAAQHGITDEQLQKLRDDDAAARKPLEEELAAVKAKNRKLTLSDRVRSEATKVWLDDRIEDGMDLVVDGPKPRLTLASDSEAIVVLDKEGKATSETLEHFLETTLKSEKPWLYKGSGASGSGAGGSSGSNNGTPNVPSANQQQMAEKRAAIAGSF